MTYRLAVNKSSIHIDGIATRTKGSGEDTGKGHVAYFAETACGALTRGWFDYRTPEVADADDMAQVLKAAELSARISNRKLCKTCTKAAEEVIAQEENAADDALDAALSKLTGAELELIRKAIADKRI